MTKSQAPNTSNKELDDALEDTMSLLVEQGTHQLGASRDEDETKESLPEHKEGTKFKILESLYSCAGKADTKDPHVNGRIAMNILRTFPGFLALAIEIKMQLAVDNNNHSHDIALKLYEKAKDMARNIAKEISKENESLESLTARITRFLSENPKMVAENPDITQSSLILEMRSWMETEPWIDPSSMSFNLLTRPALMNADLKLMGIQSTSQVHAIRDFLEKSVSNLFDEKKYSYDQKSPLLWGVDFSSNIRNGILELSLNMMEQFIMPNKDDFMQEERTIILRSFHASVMEQAVLWAKSQTPQNLEKILRDASKDKSQPWKEKGILLNALAEGVHGMINREWHDLLNMEPLSRPSTLAEAR